MNECYICGVKLEIPDWGQRLLCRKCNEVEKNGKPLKYLSYREILGLMYKQKSATVKIGKVWKRR